MAVAGDVAEHGSVRRELDLVREPFAAGDRTTTRTGEHARPAARSDGARPGRAAHGGHARAGNRSLARRLGLVGAPAKLAVSMPGDA
ncbi:MAG TPA: hypothetical protein VLU41_17395, partial [Ideonella sp.]|nr:hypothetical protein [Ideonella sp.]